MKGTSTLSSEHYLYWLAGPSATNPLENGYIGVTNNVRNRLKDHYAHRTAGRHEKMVILFKGTRDQCLFLERILRPQKMARNRRGGDKPTGSYPELMRLIDAWQYIEMGPFIKENRVCRV